LINFKLLRKEAEEQEKEVIVISSDKMGRELAAKAGLRALVEEKELFESSSKEERERFKSREISENKLPYFGREEVKREKSAFRLKGEKTFSSKSRIIVIAVLILLFILGIVFVAFYVLPQGTIVLTLKAEKIKTDFKLVLRGDIVSLDKERGMLPARFIYVEGTKEKSGPTSGTKNIGRKASGTMTVINKSGLEQTLVAGTVFRSSGGLNFLSARRITVPGAYVDGLGNKVNGSAKVAVTAEGIGEKYNLSSGTYTIPALSSSKQELIFGSGSAMSGGESRVARVVSKEDYKQLKAKVLAEARKDLEDELADLVKEDEEMKDYLKNERIVEVNSEPGVGKEGNSFKLKIRLKISAALVKDEQWNEILTYLASKNIDEEREILPQSLGDENLEVDLESFSIREEKAALAVSATPFSISKIDTEGIKREAAGMSESGIESELSAVSEIEGVKVELWPFWVLKMPKDEKKIRIKIEASEGNL